MKQEKKAKLIIEFTITVDEEKISTGDDPESKKYNDRQRRLLQAIISDKERYDVYLHACIVGVLECMSWQNWHEELLGGEDSGFHRTLAPMIASMSKSDQKWFKKAEDDSMFSEHTEDVLDCFTTTMGNIQVVVENDHEK